MDWNHIAEEYLAVAEEIFGPLREEIDEVANEIVERLRSGGKVMMCGNGGSAADAQHFSAELVNRYVQDRKPYAALALSTDTSIMTSIGNDYSFEQVFEKQVQALGREGDVLIAISTSGASENIWRAVDAAKKLGVLTVGLTGGPGGRLAGAVDRSLCVGATTTTARIQEGHCVLIHALCQRIEEALG